MTLNGAIMQLVEMRDNSMMPEVFKPYFDKVIETVSECEEPSIIPERKKGKWLANGDIPKECPFCGEDWDRYVFGDICYTGELPKFCPNCGADMRGKQE